MTIRQVLSLPALLCLVLGTLALTPPDPKAPHKLNLVAPGDTVKGVSYRLKGSLLAGDTIVIVWKRSGVAKPDTNKTRNTTAFNLPSLSWIFPPAAGVTDTVTVSVAWTRPGAESSPPVSATKVRRSPVAPPAGVESVEFIPASYTLRLGQVDTACAFLRWSDGVATRTTPYNRGCEGDFLTWSRPFRPSRRLTPA